MKYMGVEAEGLRGRTHAGLCIGTVPGEQRGPGSAGSVRGNGQGIPAGHSGSPEEAGSPAPPGWWVGRGGLTLTDCLPPHAHSRTS